MERRRGRARRIPAHGAQRGHPAGARVIARGRPRVPDRALAVAGFAAPHQPVRTWRQGRVEHSGGAPLMARITDAFAAVQASGRPGLVAYVTAGDPSLDRTVDLLITLGANRSDVLEGRGPLSAPPP